MYCIVVLSTKLPMVFAQRGKEKCNILVISTTCLHTKGGVVGERINNLPRRDQGRVKTVFVEEGVRCLFKNAFVALELKIFNKKVISKDEGNEKILDPNKEKILLC